MDNNISELEQEMVNLQQEIDMLQDKKSSLSNEIYLKRREYHKQVIANFLPDDATYNIRCVWIDGNGKVTPSEFKTRELAIEELEDWLDFHSDHAGHSFEFVGKSIVIPRLALQREYPNQKSMTAMLEIKDES